MQTKPVQTVPIRDDQTEWEGKAEWQRPAARDSSRSPILDQLNQPLCGQTAPISRHDKQARPRPAPSASKAESIVQDEPEDLPRLVHVVVGLLVITIVCAFVALLIRCNDF
jgi:hypothetical protein